MNRYARQVARIVPSVMAAALALAVAGCSDGESAGLTDEVRRDPVAVTVAKARRQEVRVELSSVGRLVSLNTPQLAAEVDARVVDVLVDEGEPIARGQELVRLDTTALELSRREAQAAIQQLNANIANDQRRVARYRDLKTRDVMPQESLDDAEAQLAVNQAALAAAEARLAIVEDRLRKTRLLSPVDGVVERRHVSVGDFAKVGSPLLTVTDTRTLRAELPFPETVAAQLRVGQSRKPGGARRRRRGPRGSHQAPAGLAEPVAGGHFRSDQPGPVAPGGHGRRHGADRAAQRCGCRAAVVRCQASAGQRRLSPRRG